MNAQNQTAEGLSLKPRSVERPADAGSTLVAGIDGIAPALVDGGGLVSPYGDPEAADKLGSWSIDWWVGADDRWQIPAREPSVRQRRIGHGPVIETSLRVPSGDVLQTVYPMMVGGRSLTVIEITNESPVPVALAIAIRPYSSSGDVSGPAGPLELLDTLMVTVGGCPVLWLPRKPNEAGASPNQDLFDAVTSGQDLAWDGPVAGPMANAVCLYPLPHKTSLRFVVGPLTADRAADRVPAPIAIEQLPERDAAVRGWNAVVERAARFEFPEPGVSALAGAARARLVMAGSDLSELITETGPGAGSMLAALAAGGHMQECRWSAEALANSFPTRLSDAAKSAAQDAAEVVSGAALAAELVADEQLNQRLLEVLAQFTHLIERSGDKTAAATAKLGLARLARAVGQLDAAADLQAEAAPTLDHIDLRESADLDAVTAMAEQAAPAKRWAGPELHGAGPDGPQTFSPQTFDSPQALDRPQTFDSPYRAAEFWLAARDLLIREGTAASSDQAQVVDLLPSFPTAWRGGAVEVHQAPIAGATVSFAVRWHGYRPALLWEVSGGPAGLILRCPGLDPDWSTTEASGEALLAGSATDLPDAPAAGDSFS